MSFPNITRGASFNLEAPLDIKKFNSFTSSDGSVICSFQTDIGFQGKFEVAWPFQDNEKNPSQVILKLGFTDTTDMEHVSGQFDELHNALIKQFKTKEFKKKLKETFPGWNENFSEDIVTKVLKQSDGDSGNRYSLYVKGKVDRNSKYAVPVDGIVIYHKPAGDGSGSKTKDVAMDPQPKLVKTTLPQGSVISMAMTLNVTIMNKRDEANKVIQNEWAIYTTLWGHQISIKKLGEGMVDQDLFSIDELLAAASEAGYYKEE